MKWLTSYAELSGASLLLGFGVMLAGALLFISRPVALTPRHPEPRLILERGLIMTAVVLTMLGLLLLAEHLGATEGRVPARAGAYLYLTAGALILTAEALGLSQWDRSYALVVAYVVMALLAQAAIGIAIILSGSLPVPLGWATILWNAALLVILPLATPADIYFPIAHHLMPLAIGLSLLLSR